MSTAAAGQTARGDRTDHELVGLVREGDERAFELLYARYGSRVCAYVGGMVRDHGVAEDLTQEIFMSALRRMRETERPIAFRPWVYEIARNACIDQFRRTRRMEEVSYDGDDGFGDPDGHGLTTGFAAPDDAYEAKEELSNLCGAFGGLSESHHEILVLRELEGLSYREIGERMGLSRPAVESTLFRARRRLTEEYDELASGRRCVRVQGILAAAAEGMMGSRDRRRLDRHLSHCQACRRHAFTLGVEELLPARTGVVGRLAALLPIPGFLRQPRDQAWSQWSPALAPAAEPIAAAWKGAAALAALALASAATDLVRRDPPPAKPAASPVKAAPAPIAVESPGLTALKIGSGVGSAPASLVGTKPSRSGASGGGGRPATGTGNGTSPASGLPVVSRSTTWVKIPVAGISIPTGPVAPSKSDAESTPRLPSLPAVGDVTPPSVQPPSVPVSVPPVAAPDEQDAPQVPDAVSKAEASDPVDLPKPDDSSGVDGKDDEGDGDGKGDNERDRKSGGDRDK